MNFYDTASWMHDRLEAEGVKLVGEGGEAAFWKGPASDAQAAWRAFCDMCLERADDPVDGIEVVSAGFQFEAEFSSGWPQDPHDPDSRAMPEHFELMFTRQFAWGEDGEMRGLEFTIFVPAGAELRLLRALIWGENAIDGPTPVDPVRAWISEVEAHEAFKVPMEQYEPERFSFYIRHIG